MYYKALRDNYNTIKRIFEILIDEKDSKTLKSAALLAAANITYHENSFEKYQSFLNIDLLFQKLKPIYNDLESPIDKEYIINIFTNLANIKEFHFYIFKY